MSLPPDLSHIDPDLVPILQGLDTRITKLETVAVPPPPVNVIMWRTIPTVTFTQGIAASFDVTPFVSNSLGLPLTLTLSGAALPAGILFDGKQFNYDGVGTAASIAGFILTASDGRTP